jgi:TatA/E family protein of Tat protein translocase
MTMGIENPIHLLFIGAVALIVLGPKRLPEVAKALGHGIREFREAISQPPASHAPPPAAAYQPPAATHEPAAPTHEPAAPTHEPMLATNETPAAAHGPSGPSAAG